MKLMGLEFTLEDIAFLPRKERIAPFYHKVVIGGNTDCVIDWTYQFCCRNFIKILDFKGRKRDSYDRIFLLNVSIHGSTSTVAIRNTCFSYGDQYNSNRTIRSFHTFDIAAIDAGHLVFPSMQLSLSEKQNLSAVIRHLMPSIFEDVAHNAQVANIGDDFRVVESWRNPDPRLLQYLAASSFSKKSPLITNWEGMLDEYLGPEWRHKELCNQFGEYFFHINRQEYAWVFTIGYQKMRFNFDLNVILATFGHIAIDTFHFSEERFLSDFSQLPYSTIIEMRIHALMFLYYFNVIGLCKLPTRPVQLAYAFTF